MFEREAAIHAAVHHENVVKSSARECTGTSPGSPWSWSTAAISIRLLRRLASGGRKLAPGVAVHVGREVLRALESVHGARDASGQPIGIIHRDVTPSNIYLSSPAR